MISNYNFLINDYQAIKEANIEIDSITVLMGMNGCGKSTIAKWIYYTVNGVINYDNILFHEYIYRCECIYNKYLMLEQEIADENSLNFLNMPQSYGVYDDKDKIKDNPKEYLIDQLNILINHLIEYINSGAGHNQIDRILNNLGIIDINDYSTENISKIIRHTQNEHINEQEKKYLQDLRNRKVSGFLQRIHGDNNTECLNDIPFISLSEDNNTIFDNLHKDNYLSRIFGLKHVIYIGHHINTNVEWGKDLQKKLEYDNSSSAFRGSSIRNEVERIMEDISNIIGGKIIRNPNIFDAEKLVFQQNNGNQVSLSKIASGFILFAYIHRLLDNEMLMRNTLFITDGPESYLHSALVSEMADIFIRMNKLVGIQILLSAHNQQFLDILKSNANIVDNMRFYKAEPYNKNGCCQYIYCAY